MPHTTIWWIAQVFLYVGNFCFCISSIFKNKKTIIGLQSTNHLISSICQSIIQAYAGAVQDAAQLIKNIILLFVKEEKKILRLVVNILIIIAAVTVGIILNVLLSDNIWYGYFPIISTAFYSSLVLIVFTKIKNPVTSELILKSGLIINGILWGMYGILVEAYSITIFNSITLILSVISIIRIIINKNKKVNENAL